MGIKEITERALAQIVQGTSRRDIFAGMIAANPADAGKIAYCIASIPEDSLRAKYLRHNALLCLLLIVYSVLTIITGLPIPQGEPTIFLVLTSSVPLIFCYFIFRFHGGIYRLMGIWFLVDLFETVLLTGTPDGLSALKLLTLFFIVTLSFLIGRKVFPHLGILGPKKDGSGHYQL